MDSVSAMIVPPTYRSPPIPTPPATVSAPESVLVLVRVDRIVAVVLTVRPFLTTKSLCVAIVVKFPCPLDRLDRIIVVFSVG